MTATPVCAPRAAPPASAPAGRALLRGLAIAAAGFAIVNAVRELASPGASAAYLLFHVPGAPGGPDACLGLMAALLLASAFAPIRSRAVAAALATGLCALALLAGLNALEFYRLLAAGQIRSAWPVPMSALVAAHLALHAAAYRRPCRARPGPAVRAQMLVVAAALAGSLGAALFHIHAFGLTDYRRPADAIVVFGARAYSNGTPSEALRERVETGAALYRAGLAPRLILSGGVDPSGVSEPRVMRDVALEAGVPDEAIIEDELGETTEATVRDVDAMAGRLGIRSVLMVSHYFHLPRIKLLATRRGLPCFTVPADEGPTRLRGTSFYLLREAVALAYYFAVG
ncbi:MAG: YdcF family protein [Polyangiaceae bacterium]|nr:YdcF family protein [Polyangiaceae bacterium]